MIVSNYHPPYSKNPDTMQLFYDSAGRCIKAIDGIITSTFTYSSDSVNEIRAYTISSDPFQLNTYYLRPDSRPDSVISMSFSGINLTEHRIYIYQYNQAGELDSLWLYNYDNRQFPYTGEYFVKNGNLEAYNFYSFAPNPNGPAKYKAIFDLTRLNTVEPNYPKLEVYWRNKNLLIYEEGGKVLSGKPHYTYTFDSSGNVQTRWRDSSIEVNYYYY